MRVSFVLRDVELLEMIEVVKRASKGLTTRVPNEALKVALTVGREALNARAWIKLEATAEQGWIIESDKGREIRKSSRRGGVLITLVPGFEEDLQINAEEEGALDLLPQLIGHLLESDCAGTPANEPTLYRAQIDALIGTGGDLDTPERSTSQSDHRQDQPNVRMPGREQSVRDWLAFWKFIKHYFGVDTSLSGTRIHQIIIDRGLEPFMPNPYKPRTIERILDWAYSGFPLSAKVEKKLPDRLLEQLQEERTSHD